MQRLIGLNLLGGYSHADGGHERLPRKSRALFAYLSMQGPRGASRDRLGDLLWDCNDSAKARHSLRQCLASLRRALPEDAPDPVTAVDRDRLATRSGAIDVDAHRMETLAQSSNIADLAAAAALYRGPFLNDFDVDSETFRAWARAERERLENVAAGALRRLVAAASEANDAQAALAAATRLAALDPLNEDDQQLLIRVLASSGRRVEALRQYDRLKEALRIDLGVPPNEASRALARALRAETFAVEDGATAQPSQGDPPLGVSSDPAQPGAPPGSDELSDPSLRPLAVLACEWLGMEALPEERQQEAVTACYRRCGEWLEAQGAHVARNASDGVVAYFGYDEAREDTAETCARAALELRSLAVGWSEEFSTAIQISAGIAFGGVVVRKPPGEKGPEAVGSAVNLACRMRSLAAPGEILIEPEARSLVRGLFTYGDFRSVDVKGQARPLQVAPVLDETETESRFEALRPQRRGPMVGREEELERLARRWRQAHEGEGAAVLLVGEPGIGKSRLVQALLDHLGEQAGGPLRLFCSPHGADSALHPFAGYLKRAAGVIALDSETRRRAKLAAMIADAGLPSHIVPWLAPVAGISDDSRSAPTLSPGQDRDKRLDALISLIGARAARRSGAALIVVEDVHWADPTTVQLIDRLVESVSRQRVLLLLTARPEYSPAWAGRAQTTSMTLGRLPAREAAKIVAQTTAGTPLPAVIFERILERAEGVPLFLEELSRAVVEKRGAADGDAADGATHLDIPQTLQALLLARLDRLGAARPVAQIAAALGRTFGYRLIRVASALAPEQIDAALSKLVEAEWVWRRGATTEAEYVFRHALLQDAAYHSLAREQRRALHKRIMATLEAHCPDIVAAQPEALARHCAEAGLMQKAAALWSKAGQLSLARSGLQEAAAHFERALAILETLPSTKPGRAEQLVAQVGLANALMHTRGYAAEETRAAFDRAQQYYERAEQLGEPPEDPSILLAVLHGFWVASHVAFDGPAVRNLSQTFMTLANKRDSIFAHAVAHRIMGTSLLFLGDIAGGHSHLDRALALYDPVAHRPMAARFGQDVGVAVLSNRPLALWLLGYVDDAERDAAAAVAMARSVGQLGTMLYMLTRIAWIKLTIGDFAAANELIAELSTSTSHVDASYWTSAASILRGCYDALVGDAASGVALIGAGVAASRARGAKLLRLPWYFFCLAKAHARRGDMRAARDCLSEAFAAVANSEEAWPEAELHRLAGEFALASKDPDRSAAMRHFERSLAVARRQRAKSFELRAAISLARLGRDLGEPLQAAETLRRAYNGFTQGPATPDLKLGAKLLAELGIPTAREGRSPTSCEPLG